MPIPKGESVVEIFTQEAVKVRIADISVCGQEEDVMGKDGNVLFKRKYPWTLSLETVPAKKTEKPISLFNDRVVGTLTTRNWVSKFYVNQKYGSVNYSMNGEYLLAVIMTLRGNNHPAVAKIDEDRSVDLNKLIGQEFSAVLAGGQENKWIDWVETFKINSIYVPTKNEVEMKISIDPFQPQQVKIADSANSEEIITKASGVDHNDSPEDLPWEN